MSERPRCQWCDISLGTLLLTAFVIFLFSFFAGAYVCELKLRRPDPTAKTVVITNVEPR